MEKLHAYFTKTAFVGSFLTIVIIVAVGCSAKGYKTDEPDEDFPVLDDNNAAYDSMITSLYPLLDSFRNAWLFRDLTVMNEPTLDDYKGDNTIYRFTCLRSFDNHIAVRIEKQGDNIQLDYKVIGIEVSPIGKLIDSGTIKLTMDQFAGLEDLVQKANFWKLPANEGMLGFDGASWIIEGVKNHEYHVVDRWSPSKADNQPGTFRSIAEYMITLSGIRQRDRP